MNPAIIRAYEEIALERPHVCTGCGTKKHLSHSHLIPKSYRKNLEAVKENIALHCLSIEKVGCHHKWEGMQAPELKDFIANMLYIYQIDRVYFWKKYFKLKEHWEKIPSRTSSTVLTKLAKLKILVNE